jgi:hypothetical protein
MPPSTRGKTALGQGQWSTRLSCAEKWDVACKLTKHLHDADARQKGLRQSLCLYLKYKNQFCPPNNPWLGCMLFGEKGYFINDKALTGAPPTGTVSLSTNTRERNRGCTLSQSIESLSSSQSIKQGPKPLSSPAAALTMDQISDLFALRGGRQGSGCKSPPPARGRQQARTTFCLLGVSLSTQEWEGPLIVGLLCAQSNGTSLGELAVAGMRNWGGGR